MERLEGINKVEKEFYGHREKNTVYYDPSKITIGDMERALKNAGIYWQTLKDE